MIIGSVPDLEMPWLVLFIFIAEALVVTISTLRMIFLAKGMKYLAPVLGFFEVTIWLFAIGAVMKNLNDMRCAFAFATGFTLGNYLGILIEQRLALGSVVVRTISSKDTTPLEADLREAGYGVTTLPGQGANGPVQVVFTVVPRRELMGVQTILKRFDPDVFYSVDALQAASAGVVPVTKRRLWPIPMGLFPVRLFAKE